MPSWGSKPAQTWGGGLCRAHRRLMRSRAAGPVGGAQARGLSWRGAECPGSPAQRSKPSRASFCTQPAQVTTGPQRSWGPPHGGALGQCSEP